MDELRWGPRPAESIMVAGVGVILCGVAVFSDAMGRVLAILAGVGLLAVALADVVTKPRLRADAEGLTARSLTGRTTLSWQQVRDVRVDERRGVAIRSKLLEIDADETLVLLSRRALGADPAEVADALADLRGVTN